MLFRVLIQPNNILEHKKAAGKSVPNMVSINDVSLRNDFFVIMNSPQGQLRK